MHKSPAQNAGAGDAVVYIIDDDLSVRESLKDLLASVALSAKSFGSVQQFLESRLSDAPGCLILDVRMPGQSGMDFLSHMSDMGIEIPTIVITGHGDIAMAVKAMKDGAIEFLAKPFRDQDLLEAIHRGVESSRAKRRSDAARQEVQKRWVTLSPGEQDVARSVAKGRANKQIAAELNLSVITIKVRRNHLMRKLDVRTVADLIRLVDRFP